MKKYSSVGFQIVLLQLLFTDQLYAYMDPGSLSYLASIIIGALVAILMYIKIIWAKITQIVHKIKKPGFKNEDS